MTDNPYRSSEAEQSSVKKPRRRVSLVLLAAVLLLAGVILAGALLAVPVSRTTTAPVVLPAKSANDAETE